VATNKKAKPDGEKAVVVTTEHRGVFFGYASDIDGEQIKLRAARLCVYWSPAMRGFMGLASAGPDKDCKIGPPVESITLRAITSVVECSPAAIEKWEAGPWNG
jgi:hypothetical protein